MKGVLQNQAKAFGLPAYQGVWGLLLMLSGCSPQEQVVHSLPRAQPVLNPLQPTQTWWVSFKDPLMAHFSQEVLEHNLDLKQALTRIQEARALRDGAQSFLLPDLSVQASAVRANNAIGTLTPQSLAQIGVDARWELDVFGANQATISAQGARLDAAKAMVQDVRRILVADVIRGVIEWRQACRILDQTRQLFKTQTQHACLLKAQTQAGLADARVLKQLEAIRDQTAAQIPLAKAAVKQVQYQLEYLMGKQPESLTACLDAQPVVLIQAPPPREILTIPVKVIGNRTDVRKACFELIAAKAELEKAEADLWPKLNLGSFFGARETSKGLERITASNPIWSLTSGLVFPLFNFGRLQQAVKAADARTKRAALVYEQTVLAAFREAHTALSDYLNGVNAVAQQQAVLKHRQEGVNLAQERFQRGLSDQVAVVIAQAEQDQAAITLTQRQTNAATAYVRLKKAVSF